MKQYNREVSAGELHSICLPCNAKPTEGITVYTIEGKTPDNRFVFLRGVKELKAGEAYLFCSDHRNAVFLCEENSVTVPEKATSLQGTFRANPELSRHSYVLYNNSWYLAGNRVSIDSYCASLRIDTLPNRSTGLAMNVYKCELQLL